MSLSELQQELWGGKGIDFVEGYWNDSGNAKRTEWMAKQIQDYNIKSIFEVGIMGGNNLRILNERLPGIEYFGGLDINQESIKFAQNKMPEGNFYLSSATDIHNIEHKYDLIFTAGVMIHIPPDIIDTVLEGCVAKANKYVMHIEGLSNDIVYKGPKELNPQRVARRFQWKPDLIGRYKKLGYEPVKIALPKIIENRDVSHLIIVQAHNEPGKTEGHSGE